MLERDRCSVEDSTSTMLACLSEDELLGDVLPATPVVPNVLYTVFEVFDPDWNFHEVAPNAIQGVSETSTSGRTLLDGR